MIDAERVRVRAIWRRARKTYYARHKEKAKAASRKWFLGLSPEVKREKARTTYIRNRAKRIALQMAIYRRNKERIMKYNSDRRLTLLPRYMIASAKYRAKRAGIPFSLTERDIQITEKCPVLGIPLRSSKGITDGSPSIDRIIPALGYVPGNVCVISHKANRLKSNATPEELRAVAEYASRGSGD